MKQALFILAAAASCAAHAQFMDVYRRQFRKTPPKATVLEQLKAEADYFAAARNTGELLATGNVHATALPYRFQSDRIERTAAQTVQFGGQTLATTCTNCAGHLHWSVSSISPFGSIDDGEFKYEENRAIHVRNAWLRLWEVPVLWVPYWYYPLNTDYGWRFMPGYTSRWGGYLLSGYVYNIINEGTPDKASLGGSTYLDYRTKNGFAVGQTIRWNLLDFGSGHFKLFNAWDDDADRYSPSRQLTHLNDQYRNWGSPVSRERYRILFRHSAELTERDTLNASLSYLSDSFLLNDFLRREFREECMPLNEISYEHRELSWALGGSVSGPVNRFYGGVARLPEAWVNIAPQPIFSLPLNYESQTRAGYLNRQYAEYSGWADPIFRYRPLLGEDGRRADYQAFRADSAHRVSVPFKICDIVSIVPRATYRGTYWSDSGNARNNYMSASGSAVYRNIWEFGFTAAARATAWLNEKWRHTFEPYLDYSYQGVQLSSGDSRRHYYFDNFDRSMEWLDQFGFEGRGLPYQWHGVRPGVRNFFQTLDADNFLRNVFDLDLYAAVPFETVTMNARGPLRGYPVDDADGTYNPKGGRHQIVPGVRLRYAPSDSISIHGRAEYDSASRNVSYADLIMQHTLSEDFAWYFGYLGRDHRCWDYLPSAYERFDYVYSNIIGTGFRHNVCDWLAWSPFVRYDARRGEVEEIGLWVDLMTDCLGFRFLAEHETSYRRIDNSKEESDTRIAFFIYLRALGADSMLDLAKF